MASSGMHNIRKFAGNARILKYARFAGIQPIYNIYYWLVVVEINLERGQMQTCSSNMILATSQDNSALYGLRLGQKMNREFGYYLVLQGNSQSTTSEKLGIIKFIVGTVNIYILRVSRPEENINRSRVKYVLIL